jgi:transcriptional regulator with XRE-family HTH domain
MPKKDSIKQQLIMKLKNIRREKGLSLHALADKVGMGYQTVGRVERGETQMTVDMLCKLAKVLNVPVSTLFNDEDIEDLSEGLKSKPKETNVYIISDIYKEVEKLCAKYNISVANDVKVGLAAVIFKSIQDIHINVTDEKEMVLAFFQGFDAIFERLVLSKEGEADIKK